MYFLLLFTETMSYNLLAVPCSSNR